MERTKATIVGVMDAELAEIVRADAEKRGIPVSEAIAQGIAKAYNRPDLAAVPRKSLGRPRIKKKKGK